MRIDNSQAAAFRRCPLLWHEKYVQKIVPITESEGLRFGKRFHQYVEMRHNPEGLLEPWDDPLEAEVAATFAAYEAHYPVEPFDVVDAEKTFELPLWRPHEQAVAWSMALEGQAVPPRHTLVGKIDCVIRFRDTGRLSILETKTERRGGQYNSPEAWAAKPQVSLYQYAVEELYHEKVDSILLNVVTRRSPKGEAAPTFRRDTPSRTREQIAGDLRDIVYVADAIEACARSGFFPSVRENCQDGWKRCEYYPLHILGRDEGTLSQFKPAEDYLGLETE